MAAMRTVVQRGLLKVAGPKATQCPLRRSFTTSVKVPSDIYDVVCIGGGPVGLSLIAALKSFKSTSHLRIALVEGQDLSQSANWQPAINEYSNRASSLTPASISFIKEMGVWDHVDQGRAQPYDEMQVWDGGNGSQIQFDWTEEAQRYNSMPRTVATMLENANLSRALLRHLNQYEGKGLDIFSKTLVSSIGHGIDNPATFNMSTWPVLSLKTSAEASEPRAIAARLMVGADGANSPARTFAGIASNGWDYGRHGVVATLTLSPNSNVWSDKSTAYQRFLPDLGGPIAILPLPGYRASLVWSTTPQNAAYLKSLSSETFAIMVSAAFRMSMADLKYMFTLSPEDPRAHEDEMKWRLPYTEIPSQVPPMVEAVQPGSMESFPLRFRHADTYVSPRVALVGDAAHTIHPLAGQGLNLGLGDARSLASTIAYGLEHGTDIGDILTLERYNSERWAANAKVGGVCDLLHKVYNVESGPIAWARGLGLESIGGMPWTKEWLMKQAEGR